MLERHAPKNCILVAIYFILKWAGEIAQLDWRLLLFQA
jgi:hypothetical protein